jgi:hypothetical protein
MVEAYVAELQSSPKWLSAIQTDCGLSAAAIQNFHLGVETKTRRVTIPIPDQYGNWVNIRFYQLPRHRTKSTVAKLYSYRTEGGGSHGKLDLFSWLNLPDYTTSEPLFIMKAEKDTMLGWQLGLQTICATCGEGSWDDTWTELISDFDAIILFDNDKGGRAGADKLLQRLQGRIRSVKVGNIPKQHKDFADWIVAIDELTPEQKADSLLPQAKPIPPPSDSTLSPTTIELHEVTAIGYRPDLLNRKIKTKAIVAAKADHSFSVPFKFEIRSGNAPARIFVLPIGRELLRFIRCGDDLIEDIVCQIVCLPRKTTEIKILEYETVIEVEVIPVAASDQSSVYVMQRCFFFGRWIESNVPYMLEVIPTSEIRSQETVGIITHAEPIARTVDSYHFTTSDLDELRSFQPRRGESSFDRLASVARELSERHTKIFNRVDWHIAALLTWCSPIGWKFPGETDCQRGWINALALGDTETGKTQVAKILQRLFSCGHFISSENCTYVGLVGGAIKMGSGQLMLRWGRIPLCDKQLVILEELSGLSITDISNMSDLRSSGIARLDKGGLSSETHARTRFLAISNVRAIDKRLADYPSGVTAVQKLIGHGEDIARFDLIVTLTDKEVASEVINRPVDYSNSSADSINPQQWQNLIRFIWGLKPEQIDITTEAYLRCLELTQELGQIYHSSVPLFKDASGRYKLTRIAAAIACLQFHWNGVKITIEEEHIECAGKVLRMLYDKPSLGYLEYSERMYQRENVGGTDLLDDITRKVFADRERRHKSFDVLIHSEKFTRDEMMAAGSISQTAADLLIGTMYRERVLRKGEANVWEITPAGLIWMKSQLQNNQPHNHDNKIVDIRQQSQTTKKLLRSK